MTVATVTIFHRDKQLISHRRSLRPHRPIIVPSTCPVTTGAFATERPSASAARPKRSLTHRRVVRPNLEQAFRFGVAFCAWSNAIGQTV
jgi:hypothetical protein